MNTPSSTADSFIEKPVEALGNAVIDFTKWIAVEIGELFSINNNN